MDHGGFACLREQPFGRLGKLLIAWSPCEMLVMPPGPGHQILSIDLIRNYPVVALKQDHSQSRGYPAAALVGTAMPPSPMALR